jgi:toxin FitB
MTYLLDTDVLSELRKIGDRKADSNVAAWAKSVEASLFYISTITVMELELGILRLERRDGAQAARLRHWFNSSVLDEFSNRVLAIDLPVSLRCASLHVPDPRPERDAFIAATALVHGLAVVTRNVADFASTGVQLINPWQPQ